MPRPRALLLAAAILALTVTVTVAVLAARGHDEQPSVSPPASTSTGPIAPTRGNGASGFADPITDRYGRKVLVPNNPAGQVQVQRDPPPRVECGGGQPPSAPEQVAIEKSFQLPILVSATDGPAHLDDTVLSGYRHSPQGAVLAGWNFLARVYAGGAPMQAAMREATTLTDADRTSLTPTPPASAVAGAADRFRTAISAPDAFRVLSCDSDFVAAEWALRLDIDDDGKPVTSPHWVGVRLNLLWRGDWKVQTTRDRTALASGQRYTSLEGWTRWAL